MNQNELQAAMDAIWFVLGPEEYGCLVEVKPHYIVVDIAGEYKTATYYMSDMINIVEVSNKPGWVRGIYLKQLTEIAERAVTDIYKFQIMYDLGKIDSD